MTSIRLAREQGYNRAIALGQSLINSLRGLRIPPPDHTAKIGCVDQRCWCNLPFGKNRVAAQGLDRFGLRRGCICARTHAQNRIALMCA